MKVYIEDCILENFLLTWILLLCVSKVFKIEIIKRRLIFASIIGAVLSTFYPLLYTNGILLVCLKLLIGILIVCVAFNVGKLLLNYLCFIIFTTLFGGINIAVYYAIYGTINITNNFPSIIILLIVLITYYLVNSMVKISQKKFVISNYIYEIEIINNNNKYFCKAYLDSGNTLIDEETNMPIIVINQNLFNKLYSQINLCDLLSKNFKDLKNPHYIKSSFASGGAKILVFDIDEIKININNQKKSIKNAKIGLSYSKFNKNFNCDMLLNINCFI